MKHELILLPTQKRFFLASQKFPCYSGGFGSGKSRILCEKALKAAQINQGCPLMLVAPSYKMLHNPLWVTLEELLEERKILYKRQMTLNIVSLPYNDIYLRSGDDYNSLRGPTLSFFGIDEAAMVSEMVWRVCVGRLRHPKAKNLQGAIATTPEGIGSWIYDEFVEKNRPQYKLFQASTHENIFLPPDYVESLIGDYSDALAQSYIYGEFTNIGSSRAYHEFGEHNVKPLEYNRHAPICLNCDFNVAPMVWEIKQFYGGRLHYLDEILISDNASTEGAIEKFVDIYHSMVKNGGVGEVEIYGDSSGKHRKTTGDSDYIVIGEYLKSKNIPFIGRVPPGNPPVKDRLNSINSLLKNRGDETRMFVDPRCEMLIKDLRMVNLTKHGDIDKRRQSLTHASDAAGYGVMGTMPIKQRSVRKQVINMNRF